VPPWICGSTLDPFPLSQTPTHLWTPSSVIYFMDSPVIMRWNRCSLSRPWMLYEIDDVIQSLMDHELGLIHQFPYGTLLPLCECGKQTGIYFIVYSPKQCYMLVVRRYIHSHISNCVRISCCNPIPYPHSRFCNNTNPPTPNYHPGDSMFQRVCSIPIIQSIGLRQG